MSDPQHNHLIEEYFDENAQSWHDYYQGMTSTIHKALIDRKDIALGFLDGRLQPGASVLDAGCGAGLQALELAKKGHNVHGVDISEKMIDIARRNLADNSVSPGQCSFRVGNVLAEAAPPPGQAYDAVLALGFLQYQVDEIAALNTLRSNLKPGGFLVVSGPTQVKLTEFFGWFDSSKSKAQAARDRQTEILHAISVHSYSFKHFDRILQAAGFEVLDQRGHSFTNFRYFGWRIGFRNQIRLHRLLTWIAGLLPFLQGYANDLVVIARRAK